MKEENAYVRPDEARARKAVRELEAPVADASFRARLRDDFVSGDIAQRPGAAPPAKVLELPPWYRRPIAASILAPAAAAALLLVALVMLNRGPAWEVMAVEGEGVAVVDGTPVPLNHTGDLARAIRAGARIEVPEGAELRLVSAGSMAIAATSGSEFTVPRVPGRWVGRDIDARVTRGVVRFATAEGFDGASLNVTTPETVVRVAGATFAIICEPTGTCVCVLDGTAQVQTDGEIAAVEGDSRRFTFNDGRAPVIDGIRPGERMALASLKNQLGRI